MSDDERYPLRAGHKGHADTGRLGAKMINRRGKTIRAATLEQIELSPKTAEIVAEQIGEHFMVVRARCSELRAQGLIEDAGERGDGALGGKVIVWRATSAIERDQFRIRKAADAEASGVEQ
jgi:hypothetical protein